MRNFARIVVFGLVVGLCPRAVHAALIDLGTLTTPTGAFSGSFANDNDFALLSFEVGLAGALVSFGTTSYQAGGFDPFLTILTTSGSALVVANFIDPSDGGTYPAMSQDISGENWDDTLNVNLGSGLYYLLLTQYSNDFVSGAIESDGTPTLFLTRDDDAVFTHTDYTQFIGSTTCPQFVDLNSGSCRENSLFALNVSVVDSDPPPPAPVPEPATLTLFGIGAAGAALRKTLRRRRTPSSH